LGGRSESQGLKAKVSGCKAKDLSFQAKANAKNFGRKVKAKVEA